MEIVHNDDELKVYMATAVKEISHDSPILVDRYVLGKELEIDAIADIVFEYMVHKGIIKEQFDWED